MSSVDELVKPKSVLNQTEDVQIVFGKGVKRDKAPWNVVFGQMEVSLLDAKVLLF